LSRLTGPKRSIDIIKENIKVTNSTTIFVSKSSAHRDVVQRDDGLFEIGLGDGAAGPFESRNFAQAVASARYSGDDPPKRRRPRRANPRPLINRLDSAVATHTYATAKISSTVLFATSGDCYRAVAPNGLLIGSYASRPEATQASGVRP
jgi:hypothetical protein